MEFNKIIFPAPPSSYTLDTFPNELIWIPRLNPPYSPAVPCLFLPRDRGSAKLLLYFHGNAEDIGISYELVDHIRGTLLTHVISVEYPGYGLYKGISSAKQIIEDADNLMEFLTIYMKIQPSNIIALGRSIGSGPATWIANKY